MVTTHVNAAASGTFALGGDILIHRLGYGAMRITGEGIWGEPRDPEQAKQVLRRAVELGVDFIDTADSYGPEVSERLIAEALYPYPKGLVIATKGGFTRSGPNRWAPVGRPEYLRQCVEMSLRRLKLERIDLWQFHRIDPKVPVEESLGAIKEMQKQGKIRHMGLSEVKPDDIERAKKTVPIVSVQNQYNIGDRRYEYAAVLRTAPARIHSLVSGRCRRTGSSRRSAGFSGKTTSATVAQISLAWLLHHSPVMLPIPGTTSIEHLQENVAAGAVKLSADEWNAIENEAKKRK